MGVNSYLTCTAHQEAVDLADADEVSSCLWDASNKRLAFRNFRERYWRHLEEEEGNLGPNEHAFHSRLIEIVEEVGVDQVAGGMVGPVGPLKATHTL